MSMLIKGINLPKEGEHIVALIKSNGKCSYWKQDTEYGICEPMQTVGATQIPTPHGRIIDADLFKEIIKDSVPAWTIGVKIPTYGDMDIMDKIYYMPTILEAEE